MPSVIYFLNINTFYIILIRGHSIEEDFSFEEEIKSLSINGSKSIDNFFRLGSSTLASSSLSTTASSKFSYSKCPNLDVLSGCKRPTTRRENSPTLSDIALRENLRNPAPPKSPPEVKKVMSRSQKNNWKRVEEEQYNPSPMSLQRQQQQTIDQNLSLVNLTQKTPSLDKPITSPEASFVSKTAAGATNTGTPKHRNETVLSDRKSNWTSGSESTEDFSSFRAVSSVQQLLSLYSQQPQQQLQQQQNNIPKSIESPTSGEGHQSQTTSQATNDGSLLLYESRVEASRQMLEKNLERLIVQQGMDAISQVIIYNLLAMAIS